MHFLLTLKYTVLHNLIKYLVSLFENNFSEKFHIDANEFTLKNVFNLI